MSALIRLDPPSPCPPHRFVRYARKSDAIARVGVLLPPRPDDDAFASLIHVPTFPSRDGSASTSPSTMTELLTIYASRAVEMRTNEHAPTPLDECVLLPALDASARVACVGKNYLEHVGEVDSSLPGISRADVPTNPIIFSKASTSLCAHGDAVETRGRADVDYEGELVAVIGRACKDVDAALSDEEVVSRYVLGWSVANDVTARELQKTHQQWYLGKSCDTFCPLGPWVCCDPDRVPTLGAAEIVTRVNGEVRQRSTVDKMIFNVADLVRCVSRYQTLQPGDALLTGTPSGVGAGFNPPRFLQPGDVCEIYIQGVGVLANRVIER